MPLEAVHIDASLLFFNLAYALSTEREEVMCLLFGTWEPPTSTTSGSGRDTCRILATSLVRRLDKRRDRVEISPETLVAASQEAETMGLRVVGWYHSHPHITVLPSHVDLRTQQSMQLLDSRFVGLIISCFNADSSLRDRIQAIAFQSSSGNPPECVEVPIVIKSGNSLSSHTREQFLKLPAMFVADERGNFLKPFGGAPGSLEDPFSPKLPKLPASSTILHASASYAGTLAEIVDRIVGPTCAAFDSRKKELERKIGELKMEKARLESGKGAEEDELIDWPPVYEGPPRLPTPEPLVARATPEPAPRTLGLGIIDGISEPPSRLASLDSRGLTPEPPRTGQSSTPPIGPQSSLAVGPGWQRQLPTSTPPSMDSRAISPKPPPPPRVAVPPPSQSSSAGSSGGSPPNPKGGPPPAPPRVAVPPPSSAQQPAAYHQPSYAPQQQQGVQPAPSYGQPPAPGPTVTPSAPPQNLMPVPQPDERQPKDGKPSIFRRFSPSR